MDYVEGAVRSSINLLHPMWQTNQIGAHEVGQRRSGDGQSSTLHTIEINTSRKKTLKQSVQNNSRILVTKLKETGLRKSWPFKVHCLSQ